MYFTIVVGKPRDNGSPNVINKPIIRHPKDINKMTIAEDGKGKEAITGMESKVH
jgi:23S rRNA-/tRNA-specific pseudouridylate synthase